MAKIAINGRGEKYITNNWVAEDIQIAAENKFNMVLSREQIERVMHIIVESYDGGIGINWDVIVQAIDYMMEDWSSNIDEKKLQEAFIQHLRSKREQRQSSEPKKPTKWQ